ncbi:hypothetical protein [Gimesia maris]|jgi:hypothetical protein|uniref:Uncharacterized protein n=1 Tax=Gimesia maris TaxID=122 RepID=A0A3D3R805_9PLAN|nr:hypothetical protein [Gimesia maris]QDT77441.1 hypothetical protein Mal35_08670 [Gimesia maris]HCO24212.1 hypothetical protein [Gimesia maris]|tara:strand:+ start:112290 stop:112607 length:318 start_codon:yes stop_codon:yes gene_type:complete
MLKRFSFLRSCVLTAALLGVFSTPAVISQAAACPMCKQLNETDNSKPRAYMYSIAFMLAMPAMLLSGFGVAFFKMMKREQETVQQYENNRNPHQSDADSGMPDSK